MKSFAHQNVRTAKEASLLLQEYGDRARLNAGGTDLLGMLKDGVLPRYPELIINLKGVAGLNGIEVRRTGIKIGALTKLADIAANPLIRHEYAVLAEAAVSVATPQIRNVATVGGNLCQETRCWYYRYPNHLGGAIQCLRKGSGTCLAIKGDNRYHAVMGKRRCFAPCPSDLAVALSALDATVVIATPTGKRTVAVEEFYTSMGTALQRGELVTEIRVPKPADELRQQFVKFTLRKPVDFAMASVASLVRVENGVFAEARLALGGVAPTPLRARAAEAWLHGKPQNEATALEAAEMTMADARPLSMSEYRVEIAKVLVKRSLLPGAANQPAEFLERPLA